jgi:hypothetical protein
MSGGQGEDTGTVPQIDEGASLVEAEFAQPREVVAWVIAGLALVAGDVRRVEVLGSSVGAFIEIPVWNLPEMASDRVTELLRRNAPSITTRLQPTGREECGDGLRPDSLSLERPCPSARRSAPC